MDLHLPGLIIVDYLKNLIRIGLIVFFYEDKYYLGKEVTFLSIEVATMKGFYPVYTNIMDEKHYNIHHADAGYAFFAGCPNDSENHSEKAYQNHPIWYPRIGRNTIDIFHPLIREYYINCFRYTGMLPSTGMCNILRAVSYGYTEIYLVGIDFFEEKGYTSGLENKPIFSNQPQYVNQCERDTLLFVMGKFPQVKFYCLSETGKMLDFIPIAPICNDNPFVPLEKSPGYAKDYIHQEVYTEFRFTIDTRRFQEEQQLQEELQKKPQGFIQKIKAKFIARGMETEWNALRENIYLRLVYHAVKPIWVFIKFFVKRGS